MAPEADDIIRYRKGQMTPAEMHAFEKKVASDPFLQDAMEGAETVSPAQLETDLREIESRVRSRTAPNRLYYWSLRAAAAVALVAAATFIIRKQPAPDRPAATAEEVTPGTSPQPEPLIALGGEKKPAADAGGPSPQPSASTGVKEKKDEAAKAKSPEEPEKQDAEVFADMILAEDEAIEGQPARADVKNERSEITAGQIVLYSDSAVRQTEPLGRAAPAEDFLKASRARKSVSTVNVVSGKVVDEQGSPIPGANVVSDDRVGTITGADGRFRLAVPSGQGMLTINSIGFESRRVSAADGLEEIVLKEDTRQLSEVVVVGYSVSTERATDNVPMVFPEPPGGRRAFNRYLAREVRYPKEARDKGISGRVVVDFVVDEEGKPGDFTIVRGIGAGCDEELIRLIREGSAWSPASLNDTAIPSKARVQFRFELP
jgi:TonB family protein